tara:strand:- start:638 stop:1378 length:741 start_codon:yes stop_codon:yes gene_type:complete
MTTTTTSVRTLTGKLVAVEETTVGNGTPKIVLWVLPFSSAQHPVSFGAPQFMQPLYDNVVALLYDPETAAYKTDIHVTTQSTKNAKNFIDLLSVAIAEDGKFYDSQNTFGQDTPPIPPPITPPDPDTTPTITEGEQDDISGVLDKVLTDPEPEIKPYPFGPGAPVDMPKHLREIITEWNTQLQIGYNSAFNNAVQQFAPDNYDGIKDLTWKYFELIMHIKQAPEINGAEPEDTVDTSDSDMVIKAE